jgi:hypothetical protein
MPAITLPFAEWMPDQFRLGSPGAAVITNVVPLTPTSYGPIALAAIYTSTGLTDRVLGTYTLRDAAGNVKVFAGDATKLYVLQAGSTAWTDVSRFGGPPYAGSPWPDTLWSFTSFGQRIIACNYSDDTQTYLNGTDLFFSQLDSLAPRAKYCEAVGDFVMLANTFDGTDGTQPQRVWWCSIGDPTSWPTPGGTTAIQTQSDFQDLQQTDLGEITGLVAGPLPTASATIFCRNGVYAALYVGSPAIFSFKVIDGVPGCLSPRSIVKRRITAGGVTSGVIYYRGDDRCFYAFNGTSALPIGANRVDRFVQNEIDPSLESTVLGTIDPVKKLIYWAYSTVGSTVYNRMVAFNWDVNRWSYIDLTNNTIEWITQSASIGYTLDGLDATGYNMDTLPYSLDSEVWAGGAPVIAVFNSAHRLEHGGHGRDGRGGVGAWIPGEDHECPPTG